MPLTQGGLTMTKVYILTQSGWKEESNVLTPATRKIKKNAVSLPIEETDELTEKLRNELPMVKVIKGHYLIVSAY